MVGRIGVRIAALGTVVALSAAAASSASAADVKLPDGRGHELVSSAARNGAEVIPQTDKVHVRPDGSAVTFAASEEGAAFELEHFSARTQLPGPRAWDSHVITPLSPDAVEPAADGTFPAYVDGFAPDLSAAIFKTWQPLVSSPNVAGVANLYRIAGLDGGDATAQLMTDSVDPVPAAWFAFLDGFFVRTIQPELAGASTDLRHVVFESRLRLTADAPAYQGFCALAGFGCPIKLYENADGVVRLAGRIPQAGQTACDDVAGPACVAAPSSEAGVSASVRFYSERMVSADGRRIHFAVPGSGIYVREDGVRTEQIASSGQLWIASADGARAFFISDQSLVADDTDFNPDVYLYDREATPGTRLTLVSGSAVADGYAETIVGASADGRYVYFVSDGQLIPGEPAAPIMGLYVWHDGQLRFIGALTSLFEAELNGPRTTWQLAETAMTSRVTPDGRHLLFMTTSDAGFRGRGGFAGYDHQDRRELYLYSADSGSLACASCNPSGTPATADASIDVRAAEATTLATSDSAQALTDDGRRVFFNTAEALVPQDVDDAPDAYEYDAATGTVHLLSGGRGTAPSYVVDASPDGDDVFVVTRERLVRWDVDGRYDLYDARVGGGLPGPGTSAPQGG